MNMKIRTAAAVFAAIGAFGIAGASTASAASAATEPAPVAGSVADEPQPEADAGTSERRLRGARTARNIRTGATIKVCRTSGCYSA